MWKIFPEFINANNTYKEFKDAILDQYSDATGDYIHSIRDMDMLIGERQHIGIAIMQDMLDYHLQFLAITRWLISKGHLAELEQQRAYVMAFQPQFLTLVMNRLAIKKADHHPNIPYQIKDVYEAACFILQGASMNVYTSALSSSSPLMSQSSNEYVKTETLASMMAKFTKTMNEALSHSRGSHPTYSRRQDNDECNYCGGLHYIQDCDKVGEDIQAGKCKAHAIA